MTFRRSGALAVFFILTVPIAAQSQDFCTVLADVQSAAPTLTDISDLPFIPLPVANAPIADCGRTLNLNAAPSVHCAWPFSYRSDDATEAFEALLEAVTLCLGPALPGEADARVNHPDSYDLRLFLTDHGTVAVSLKDKGGLQETYVFLRFE